MELPRCYRATSREEQYEEGLRVGAIAWKQGILYDHTFFHFRNPRGMINNASPFGLATTMFLPILELQASYEQRARWIPLVQSGKLNGAYCQTELAHGTFVRGIQTTATFDKARDEFVINTPNVEAIKFWPGGAAHSCSHAIVMARLILGDKEYGVHPFMVQLRSLDSWKWLPRIETGDVGPKLGYNETCNGWVRFKNVRIPRQDMLDQFSKVLPNGQFVGAPHPKITYLTMVNARRIITECAAFGLAQAVTIAMRYSVVREQGLGPNGGPAGATSELAIINYRSQNYRLFSSIAKAFAILFSSWAVKKKVERLRANLFYKNSPHGIEYTHVLAAAFKCWSTQQAADAAEDARKMCGGHGVLMTSGLPNIVQSLTAACTFEGENFVLYQQVSRYLMKSVAEIKTGKALDIHMAGIADLVKQFNSATICKAQGADFQSPSVQLEIFRHRAVRLIIDCSTALEEDQLSHSRLPHEAWNTQMMRLILTARAYTEYLALESFINAISSLPKGPMHTVLDRLRSLFALTTMTNPLGLDTSSFIEDGHLSVVQLRQIRAQVDELLEQLLPDAIALTDAWDFTDATLCSCLGCWDGNVYERMMAWTEQLPFNQQMKKNDGVYEEWWEKYLKPALSGVEGEGQERAKL
ncbi:MAG: hypothetical protein Q9227_006649 [Pyrenula ochraceoflavens]